LIILDPNYAKKEIERSLSTIGRIESIEIFEYRKFLDIPDDIETIHLPPNFDGVFDANLVVAKTHNSVIDALHITRRKRITSENKKLFTGSERIISTLKKSKKKKLDKSYALIKFDTLEGKIKCMRTDLRVLGVNILNNVCGLEDADYKVSLLLYNLPYGVNVETMA
jgi:hypothetical protein